MSPDCTRHMTSCLPPGLDPMLTIPKWLPLQKEIDALQLLRRGGVRRKSQALRYIGVGMTENRRQILDPRSLTVPVKI